MSCDSSVGVMCRQLDQGIDIDPS